ncbi:hypothetical protein [Pseudomonas putida]|uniref:hypothetical protein n=1 Tax=Pseudomonas putida TaxID=303 RepID=UPI0021F8D0A9|nr:hypothetical protein [Pseudomonas putida]
MRFYWKIRKYIPDALRYQIEIRLCRNAQEKMRRNSPPDTREAHESGAVSQYVQEYSDVHQWRRDLITREYRRKLDRLSVPMPSYKNDDFWESVRSEITEEEIRCLTTDGEVAARAALREEQKHRREVKAFWLTWITGIGGIVIGVVSAWPN